ncbi:MAG: alanine--tRNA ligase, partial [Thermoplasmatales archaeon]
MIDSLPSQEYNLQFFHNNGYTRKKCKSCGAYFWTLDNKAELCGDRPCVEFNFINNPITKKRFSLAEVRESFLSFFEKNNHSRVSYPETGDRCPVIARWRSDIYLTIASIADFQPHVTSGEVPAPANPLAVSQPCIRLNDLEKVGKSGSHLTMFEMLGHHAFNKKLDEIYWKEKTVEYCNEFFRENIGIPSEKINYKEQLWSGGGNAGPCFEAIAGGLEIATLVFMNMKEDERGEMTISGKKYSKNPLNIVDTGYGLERIAWYTKGTLTIYESVFPELINFLLDNTRDDFDMVNIYALADHSKCLAFMLGDGIVPSNVKAGYLARLIIRRSLRFLEKLKLNLSLKELVDLQLDILEKEFPSLKQGKDQIDEILDIETKRFFETLSTGEGLIKKILKEKETIDKNELITLYDTHGMPPDVVKNIAKKEKVNVEIPENFDSMIAELHSYEKEEESKESIKTNLPETEPLYYMDHYTKKFDARVIWKEETGDITRVILDKTAFYPDGGGQPGDMGILSTGKKQLVVKHVEKEGNAIIHLVEGILEVGEEVHGKIDWEHRYTLMKHHTGTHVVNGALRKLFGEHIWQAGSQLRVNEARFDFSHYKSITEKEIKNIEKLANEFIKREIPVEKKVMTRNDAEREYGFRLYQGGVPPGNKIRVLNIPGIDVEACGGTHLNNIKEIEKIRILKTERIQDGVNRVIFAAGRRADIIEEKSKKRAKKIQKDDLDSEYDIKKYHDWTKQLQESAKIFGVPVQQLEKTIRRFRDLQDRVKLHSIPFEQLQNTIQSYKQLQDALKPFLEQFKQLQKTIQPSIQLKEALKPSLEQFKQLQ